MSGKERDWIMNATERFFWPPELIFSFRILPYRLSVSLGFILYLTYICMLHVARGVVTSSTINTVVMVTIDYFPLLSNRCYRYS